MPDIPDLVRPQKVVDLLLIGPRLALAGLRLTESTVRVVVSMLDRDSDTVEVVSDADHLWTPSEEHAGQNGSGDLDAAASEPPAASVAPAPARPAAPVADPPPAPLAPLDPAGGHVSEEVELVAEVADPGAEEGAGAELHVEEPWPGYDAMTAQEVVDRLAVESVEVNAVVELYERAHRNRRTVLDAAERELRRRSGPGAGG